MRAGGGWGGGDVMAYLSRGDHHVIVDFRVPKILIEKPF